MTNGADRPLPATPSVGLTRNDLAAGLRELVSALRTSTATAHLQLVGGAAISLIYDSERRSTVDVDCRFSHRSAVLDVARAIGRRRGWPDDWVNDSAAQFLPAGYGGR